MPRLIPVDSLDLEVRDQSLRPSLTQFGVAVMLSVVALLGLALLFRTEAFVDERVLQINAALFIVVPWMGALILLALLARRTHG